MHYECDKYAAQSIRSVVYIRVAISVWLRFPLKIPAQSVWYRMLVWGEGKTEQQ